MHRMEVHLGDASSTTGTRPVESPLPPRSASVPVPSVRDRSYLDLPERRLDYARSMAPPKGEHVTLEVAGREVTITNPGKVYFPEAGITKLEVARYYLAVAEGALRGAGGRPNVLVRYPNGIHGESFYQKRAPTSRPDWVEVVSLRFPSGGLADEVVPRDAAALAWMMNLGCLELHPHPVRTEDLDHPDELRIDLDPVPGVEWSQLVAVATVVRAALGDLGLVGWPKTSGSRGIHILVRIHPRWSFGEVRRAALALAREVERRAPALATSKWWKEERHGVFLDYNQNAKDRTVASAYSVRPTPDARVSAPVTWDELGACAPGGVHPPDDAGPLRRDRGPSRRDRRAPVLARLAARAVRRAGGRGSRRRAVAAPLRQAARRAGAGRPVADPERGPAGGRRVPTKPLVEIGRAQRKEDALAGLERWKARHPAVVPHLQPADVLVDSMRGRSSTWTRIRVNLEHVPDDAPPGAGAPRSGRPAIVGCGASAPIARSLTVRPARPPRGRSRPAPPAG